MSTRMAGKCRCSSSTPLEITVDWKQIGQSIFSAPSDVQRTGRSPSSTSSQSVLTIFLETPATTGPVFLPCMRPPLDLTTPPCYRPPTIHSSPLTSRSGASSSCTPHPYDRHRCTFSPGNKRTRCSARLSVCCFF